MTDPFPQMVDVIPEGVSGIMQVDHITVTEEDALKDNLSLAMGNPHFDDEEMFPGRYARLICPVGNRMLMSDAVSERKTNYEVVEQAHGNMLIAGLGLGMVLCAIYPKPEVERITIVEHSPDVIKLVMPHLLKYLKDKHPELHGQSRFRIARGDIHKWKPPRGMKYDTIYFDIWDRPSADAFLEMVQLSGRYQKWLAEGGWMRSWREDAAKFDYAEYENISEVGMMPSEPEWVTKLKESHDGTREEASGQKVLGQG